MLAPLIIAVLLVFGFFYFETRIPADRAAIPPRTWFLPNFLVLFFTALLPFFWWTTVFTIYTTLWQDVWHWSAISTAIHMYVPCSIAFVSSCAGTLTRFACTQDPHWGWAIIIYDGTFDSCTLEFPQLKVKVTLRPGDMVMLRGRDVLHEVKNWVSGERHLLVHFTHKTLWDQAEVECLSGPAVWAPCPI